MDAVNSTGDRTLPRAVGVLWNHHRAQLDGLPTTSHFWPPGPRTSRRTTPSPSRSPRAFTTIAWRRSAATALAQVHLWLAGVRGLGKAALRVPVGAMEPFPEAPMADLALHIDRELIHHLSEVCLLRDLYLYTKPGTNGATR